MFDFGFSELMLVMVVALVVIGPERLPKVARTLGHLWGRGQRYLNGIKADIERDMDIEEFRKLQQSVQAEAEALGQSVKKMTLTVDQQLQQINERVTMLATAGSATQFPSLAAAEQPPPDASVLPPPTATDTPPQFLPEESDSASGAPLVNKPQ